MFRPLMGQTASDLRLRLSELRPPAPHFTEKDIPDQSGRTFLVTGGNAGLGLRTCTVLASKGARVWLAARNVEKGAEAIEQVKRETGSDNIHFLQLDLADLNQIKRAARELRLAEKRLDVCIFNAGVMVPPNGSTTRDGHELQFGVNVLGHVALFEHIKPLILQTARASPKASTRIVIVSSSGHELAPSGGGILFDDLAHDRLTWGLRPSLQKRWNLYGQSKLGNILMSLIIAKKYRQEGLLAVSLNPGNVRTELTRHILPDFLADLGRNVTALLTPEMGALTQLYCATSPELTMSDSHGYFIPVARRGHPYRPEAFDEDLAERLWKYAEDCMHSAGAAADEK